MTATHTTTGTSSFAGRLRAAVEEQNGSVPAHRRGRDWHRAVQCTVSNPRRTRGLPAADQPAVEDFATRLRRAVG